MSDLSPETDKLLELARGAGALSGARRAQIKAGLLSQIAAGGALGSAASHASWGKAAGLASWGKAVGLSGVLAKGISALALLSVVGVGVYVAGRSLNSAGVAKSGAARASTALKPSNSPASDGRSDALAPPAIMSSAQSGSDPNAVNVDGPTVGPRGPAAPAAALPAPFALAGSPGTSRPLVGVAHLGLAPEASSGTVAEPTVDTLAEETRLLRAADQALRAGDASRALSLLDEHAARYPHGVLEPERAAERMIARCKLGRADAKSAQRYLSTHANSAFSARIQDACGSTNR